MHRCLKICFHVNQREEISSLKRVLEIINKNSQDQDGEVEPRRSKKVRTEKSFGLYFMTYVL